MPPQDAPRQETAVEIPTVPLLEIFLLFNRISSLSFGGGVTAWIYREVVEQKKWLTHNDFMSALTLSQVLPGINTANLAVYTGQRLRGAIGSFVAMLGLVSVPFFAVLAIAAAYATIQSVPGVQQFLSGIGAAAVGLLLSLGIKAVRLTKEGWAIGVIATLTLLVGILRWPMIPVVLCMAPISIWLAWRSSGPRSDSTVETGATAGPNA